MSRNVLITGCLGGIGSVMCKYFKNNNYYVIGVDIKENNTFNISSKYDIDKYYQIDLSSDTEIENLSINLSKIINKLDVIINNAAYQLCKPLESTESHEFDKIININLRAPFLLYKNLLNLLKKSDNASIINISSVHNITTSANIGIYATSKAGLAGLTRSIAIEASKYKIRCNTISPGAIDTNMLGEGLKRGNSDIQEFKNKHLLGDIGQPYDIAKMAVFLADNNNSGFITGTNIYVDGGVTIKLSTE